MSEEQSTPKQADTETKSWDKSNTKPVVDPNFVNFYTNSAIMGFTNWDMWMTFGELLGEQEEDGKLLIIQKARVTMSLSHAKVFLKILADNIKTFEEQFGKIQLLGSAVRYDDMATTDEAK